MARVTPAAAIVLAAALLALPLAAVAELYRWRDAKGVEHFASDLYSVPPEYRAAAKQGASAPAHGTLNRAESPEPPPAPGGPVQPGGAGLPGLFTPQPSSPVVETHGGRTEIMWRSEHRRLLSEIDRLERDVERCDGVHEPGMSGYNRVTHRYYDKSAQWARWEYCQRATSELPAKQAELERFKNDARRAGVPPGWLR